MVVVKPSRLDMVDRFYLFIFTLGVNSEWEQGAWDVLFIISNVLSITSKDSNRKGNKKS